MARLLLAAVLAGCGPGRAVFVARVTDGETGTPVRGAIVTVHGSEMMSATDSSGRTPPTETPVPGYVSGGGAGYLARTVPVRAADAGDTVLLDILLYPDRPRLVMGRAVTRGSNAGVGLAEVEVRGSGLMTAADGGGSFRFTDFPEGEWTLRASAPGFVAGSTAVLARGGETTFVTVTLRDTANCGRVEGTVSDASSGRPVAGLTVRVDGLDLEAVTDAEGRYELTAVPAGQHELSVFADSYGFARAPFRVTRGWTVTVNIALSRGE